MYDYQKICNNTSQRTLLCCRPHGEIGIHRLDSEHTDWQVRYIHQVLARAHRRGDLLWRQRIFKADA